MKLNSYKTTIFFILISAFDTDQGRIQVLLGLRRLQFLGHPLRKNNTKLDRNVNIYLEWEKKSKQIINLKKLTNTTNITKFRIIAKHFYKLTAYTTV